MKFFIIVSFIMGNTMAYDRPLYIFQNPSFETSAECHDYVKVMNQVIYSQAAASYDFEYKPEAIYCLPKNKVKEIFNYNYENEKPKQNI